ncbi:hypothetical protein Q7P36_007178 [Cladosporium allicinum]
MTSPVSEVHEHLADGHIRLLELNLEHENDIVGRLQTVSLMSAPAYHALSYVCGDGPYEHEVTINDVLFKVKPNLHAALRRLQSYFRSTGTLRVLIWIDAICINQDNAYEKAKQIEGMHVIFYNAKTVLVALGSVPENVHMVLSIFSWVEIYTALDPLERSEPLERLERMQEHDHREAWAGHSDLRFAGDIERLEYVTQQLKTRHKIEVQSLLAISTLLERLELFGIERGPYGKTGPLSDTGKKLMLAIDFPGLTGRLFHPNHSFWAGVYALSEIEWYQRAWTYQEVVLARNAQVLVEGLSVDWNHVVVPITGLLRATRDNTIFKKIDPEATIVDLPTPVDRWPWLVKWQQVGRSGNDTERNSLISCLINTRHRRSTLAKDKVYGLLALVFSSVTAQIPIDYAITDGEVFASGIKAELGEVPAPAAMVSFLWTYFDENPAAMEDLPSWCPNFASMSVRSRPTNLTSGHPVPDAVQQQTSAYACYEHSLGFRTICVRVLKLDTTAACVDTACPLNATGVQLLLSSDSSEASRSLEETLKHWLVQLRAAFSDYDSAPGFSREVTEFLYGTTEHQSLVPFETFWETLNHMLLLVDSDLQPLLVYDRRRDWATFREILTMISTQGGRYLFKTTSGLIGFGTRQQTPGSHVVLLPGSRRFHMLTGDCTQYSGCVCLPGMSEDALLDLVNTRENLWEMVELR